MANADIVIDSNSLVQTANHLKAMQNYYKSIHKSATDLNRSPFIKSMELISRGALFTASNFMTVFQQLKALHASPVVDLEDQASGKIEDLSNKISELSFNTGIIVDKKLFYETGRMAGEAFSAGSVDGFDSAPIRAKAENAMDGAKSTPNSGGSLLDYAGPMLTVASGLLFGRRISKKNPLKRGPKADAQLPAGKTLDLDAKVPAGKTPSENAASKVDAKIPNKTPAHRKESKKKRKRAERRALEKAKSRETAASKADAKVPSENAASKADAKTPNKTAASKTESKSSGKRAASKADAKVSNETPASKTEAKVPNETPAGKVDPKTPANNAASETAGNVADKTDPQNLAKPEAHSPKVGKRKYSARERFSLGKASAKSAFKESLYPGVFGLIPDAIDFFKEKDGAKRTEIATSALGGFTANSIGSALGAGIGTILFPGIGTAAGAIGGGILGGIFEWGGREIGGFFGKKLNKWSDKRREKKEKKKKEKEMLLQGGALINPNPYPLPAISRKLAPTLQPAPGPRPDLNSMNYDPQPSLSSPVQLTDQHMQAIQNQSSNVNVNANSELSLQPGAIQIHIETAQKENVDELVARLSARLTQELQQKFTNQRTVYA